MLRCRFGAYLGRRGRFEEAIAMVRTALVIDPAQFRINIQLAAEFLRAHRYREMLEHMQRLVELHPTNAGGFLTLCRAYEFAKRFGEAEAALLQAERLLEEGDAMAYRATLEAAQGHRSQATMLADQYLGGWREGKYESNTAACVEGALRRSDHVFEIIKTGYRKSEETVLAIPTNPYVDYLRNDRRMVAFRQQLKLA